MTANGVPLQDYYQLSRETAEVRAESSVVANTPGVRELVIKTFYDLTGVETIEADIGLTDQGLDFLSATNFWNAAEKTQC